LVLNEARGWYQDTVALTTGMLGVLAGTTSSPEIVSQEVALRMSLARALMATQGYTLEVAQSYAQALALFEGGAQDLRQHYSVLRGLASLYLLRMEFDQAVDLGRRIVAMAEAEDDLGMRIDGLLVVGSTLIMTSDLKGGLRDLETAIDLAQAGPATAVRSRQGNDPRVACLTTAAFSHWLLGHPDQAVDRAHAAIALAQRLDHPYTMAYARFHAGLLHHWLGQPEEVVEQAIRLLEIADEYEFRIWSAVGSCLLGTAETDLGRLETGLAEIRRGMADYQGLVSPPVFWPMLLYLEAGARGRAGDSTGALLPLDEAIALMGGPTSGATFMPELLILRGDLLRGSEADASRPAAEVEATYRSALAAGRSLGARISELRALTRLAAIGTTEASATDTDQLQDLLATFDEGLGTRDLTAARAVLSAGDGA